MAGKSWAFCRGFSETLSTYGHQMGLVSHGTYKKFQAVLVALWVPSWLPKLPSIFPGNFENFEAIIK